MLNLRIQVGWAIPPQLERHSSRHFHFHSRLTGNVHLGASKGKSRCRSSALGASSDHRSFDRATTLCSCHRLLKSTVPNIVPTTKPYRVRRSGSLLCRCLCRNPAIPTHVGEDYSVSLTLMGKERNTRHARIIIAFACRLRFLCVVVCLSGRSTVTQEVAGLILPTSANFLHLRQLVRSLCGSYLSKISKMSGRWRQFF